MSTVLTKPVLLDETGQAIVGKLQDIQRAIGGTGEFIPINIRVTTPPTKTNYVAGETLDLSGMVVTLVANNGGMYDVTGDCVFSPADGSTVTSSTTEVNISYTWYKDSTVFTAVQPIGIKELASIAVTTPPTQTEYFAGDELDLTGIVVTATYADGSTSFVTNDCVFSPAEGDVLAINDTTINISYTLGAITRTATQAITVEVPIYGAEWDGTATTAWTRTGAAANFTDPVPAVNNGDGSSPFDNIWPWSGIEKVEDPVAGSLVKIPKFYYRLTKNNDSIRLEISSQQIEGFKISPAHQNRGDGQGERDVIYVGAYPCAASNYKSTSGVLPKVSMSKADFNTAIHNLNATLWQWDYATYWTIMFLYLVEYANWDAQRKIGVGGRESENTLETTGGCDAMIYHTGTCKETRAQSGHVRYRYIEDLWSNVYTFIDGVHLVGSYSPPRLMVTTKPSLFNNNGGDYIGDVSSGSNYIKNWNLPDLSYTALDLSFALIPLSDSSATDSTYITDRFARSAGSSFAVNAGSWFYDSYNAGPFRLIAETSLSSGESHTGSRLMKLPSNA